VGHSTSPSDSQDSVEMLVVEESGRPVHRLPSARSHVDTRVDQNGALYIVLQSQVQDSGSGSAYAANCASVPDSMSRKDLAKPDPASLPTQASRSTSASVLAKSFLEMVAHEDAQLAEARAIAERDRQQEMAKERALQSAQEEKEKAERAAKEKAEREQREAAAASECPICFESIDTQGAVVSCKQCHNKLHSDCLQVNITFGWVPCL
jgi:uncharacterized membrane protein YqiK